MLKKSSATVKKPMTKNFLKDVEVLSLLPVSQKYRKLLLEEYPFDNQLLNISRLYRVSRKFYLALGGTFARKICSTMRGLSAQDLFKNEIDFTPALSEMMWLKNHHQEVSDPESEIKALMRFNDTSLFHEQNHRVIWQLLPPASSEKNELRRYLNFAESLVVTLDIALGDEVGNKLSAVFERLNLLYRPAGKNNLISSTKENYRKYLLAILCSTYYTLEQIERRDILKAVDYVFPQQKKLNKEAVLRSIELNEHFTKITNPLWQQRYWQSAALKLKKIHYKSKEEILFISEDPLELQEEFFYARRIFSFYGL